MPPMQERRDAVAVAEQLPEGHLHSAREVIGYKLRATDEPAGSVHDMLVDPEEGRYLVVDTGE